MRILALIDVQVNKMVSSEKLPAWSKPSVARALLPRRYTKKKLQIFWTLQGSRGTSQLARDSGGPKCGASRMVWLAQPCAVFHRDVCVVPIDVVSFSRWRCSRRSHFQAVNAQRIARQNCNAPSLMPAAVATPRWGWPATCRLVSRVHVLFAETMMCEIAASRLTARMLRFPRTHARFTLRASNPRGVSNTRNVTF